MLSNFREIFSKQAWLHWYPNIEASEFDLAAEELESIIDSYNELNDFDLQDSTSSKNG